VLAGLVGGLLRGGLGERLVDRVMEQLVLARSRLADGGLLEIGLHRVGDRLVCDELLLRGLGSDRLFRHRGGRLGGLLHGLTDGRAEGLLLLLRDLLLRRAVLALELEVLADSVVENAHRGLAYGTRPMAVHGRARRAAVP
jgi:hypothetical protein